MKTVLSVAALSSVLCLGCTGIPSGLQPVVGFDAERYPGRGMR